MPASGPRPLHGSELAYRSFYRGLINDVTLWRAHTDCRTFRTVSSLAYSTLTRLREFAEKRVWPQSRGLVVNLCHHSILCRR